MKANYEQQKYKESPLASLLTQIITKIGELKKSYSDAPVDILKQLDAMAAYLNVLHGGILPYIDNKTPGIWDLLGLYTEYGKLKKITESLNEVPTQILVTPKLILFKEIIFAAFSNYIEDFMENGTFNKELLSNKNIDSILKYEHDRIILKADKFAETDNREILEAEFNTIKQTLLNLNLSNINFSGDIGQILSVVLELTGCFTNPELSAAFKISHPVFLELFVFLANQLETLPIDLKNLVSFLKPETIPELISSLPGSTLSVTHQGNYNYNVGAGTFDLPLDLPLIYSALHTLPRQLIIPGVISYMDFVEPQKKALINNLVNAHLPIDVSLEVLENLAWLNMTGIKDKELIHTFLPNILPALRKVQEVAVGKVQEEMAEEAACIEKKLEYVKEHLSEYMKEHQVAYNLKSDDTLIGLELIKYTDKLIQNNANLQIENIKREDYLNTTFSLKEPLKLDRDQDFKIIERALNKDIFNPLINKNKQQIKIIHEKLCENKLQFLNAGLKAVDNWLEAVQDSCSEGLANYKLELSSILDAVSLQDDAKEISTKSKKSKKITKKPIANDTLNTNPIEALEKDIECLSAKVLNLDILNTQCTDWSKNYIPKLLNDVSGDKSLEEPLIKLSKQLSPDTHLLIEDIHAKKLKLNHEIATAKNQLGAARDAAVLDSGDSEEMKKTIAVKETGYKDLEIKIKTFEVELDKANEEIELTHITMKELENKRIDKKNGIAQVVSDIEILINELNGISTKYQSTNQSKSIIIETCSPDNFINWTDKEILFLKTLSKQYEEEGLRELKPYDDKLQLLNKIDKTLEINEVEEKLHSDYIFFDDRKLPFQALDTLINTSTDNNRLFILLDLDKTITYWSGYRSRQDEPLKFAPDEKERNEARGLLRKAAEIKIKEVKKDIQDIKNNQTTKQNDITSSLEILLENKELFVQKNKEKETFEQEIVLIQRSYDECVKSNQRYEKIKQTQSETILTLKKGQQSIKDSISTFNLVIEILQGLRDHGELITSFCTGDMLFNLEDSIQPIEALRNGLKDKIFEFETGLDKLESIEKDSFQPMIKKINDTLTLRDDRIKATMQSRYEITCINPIAEYQDAHNILCDNHTGLINNPQTTWEGLFDTLAPLYNNLSKQMKEHEANVLSADRILTVDINRMMFTPSDAFYEEERQNTKKLIADLNKKLSLLGVNIEDHASIMEHTINVTLEGDKALIFNAINPNEAYPETEAQHLMNTTLLHEVKTNFEEVYVDFAQLVKNPDNLKTLKEKIKIYNDAKTQASNKLEASLLTNDALAQRIADRKLVVETQVEILTTYLAKRNEQFYFKDKAMRTHFITDLHLKLNAYKDSGNSKEVFDSIRDKRKKLAGGELEHILNQLTVKIMDSDYEIPTSYVLSDNVEKSLKDQAKDIFIRIGQESDYYKRVEGLHAQVTVMRDFGNSLDVSDPCRQIAVDLANTLDEDIYRFVIKHKDNVPGPKAYEQFQDKFIARAHSKDQEKAMQPYLPRWAAILANIAIAVVSLGFALGVKAISSYVKTGESFLFFRQSDMQEKVGEINKLAKEILSAPAVA